MKPRYYVQTVKFVKQNGDPKIGYRAETMQLFAGLHLTAYHNGNKPKTVLLEEGRKALDNIFQLAEMSEEEVMA